MNAIESQLAGFVRRVVQDAWKKREADLKEEIDLHKSSIADVEQQMQTANAERRAELIEQRQYHEGQIEKIGQDKRDEKMAYGSQRLTIVPRDFAGSCYVVRMTGKSPDELGMQASEYTAWMRNGDAPVTISFAGNFPPDEMTRAMDHFLSEMAERTSTF